jgi:hypothetical protein
MENNEVFLPIPGFEDLYQISNFGNVKSLAKTFTICNTSIKNQPERILKPQLSESGYYHVVLCKNGIKKTICIHVLVAMAFLGHLPNGRKIVPNHKNSIKTDNRAENLELETQRGNTSKYYLTQKTSSQYTGVCWNKKLNKWKSTITINCKTKHLGYYSTEYEAHYAYQSVLLTLQKSI